MKNYNAMRVLEKPYVDLPMIMNNMKNKRDVSQLLAAIAERAGIMAAYIEERDGYGCGDQGHEKALKAMNKTGRIIHMKAFGFNAFHDLSF